MEYEVRFYYESEELKNILKGLKGESALQEQPRTYEKTIQYNHSDERFVFDTFCSGTESPLKALPKPTIKLITTNAMKSRITILGNFKSFKSFISHHSFFWH